VIGAAARVAVAVVLVAGAACTRAEPVESPRASGPRVHAGGSLDFGLVGSPATLDPYSPLASDLTRALARPLYPSLFRLRPDGSPEPDLARRSERVGGELRVRIRRALWSDGRPVTAHDVIASARRARPPSGFTAFDSVRADGRRTVVFEPAAAGGPTALASAAFVLPRGRWLPAVSGGPFRMRSHTPGLEVVYERNPRWDGAPARLDGFRAVFVEDVRILLELLSRGRLAAAAVPATVNLDEASIAGTTVRGALGWERVFVRFGPGVDVGERAAIAAALDREAMEEAFVRDDGRVSNTVTPGPGPRGAAGDGPPATARASSPTEELLVSAPEGDELLALVQRAVYTQLTRAHLDAETVSVDAETFYGLWAHDNPADLAIVRAAGAPRLRPGAVPGGRAALPLFHLESYVAWRRGVHGITPNPTLEGPLWNAEDWSIDRGAGDGPGL
jgi:ABC-type transport system substrate-binding protein